MIHCRHSNELSFVGLNLLLLLSSCFLLLSSANAFVFMVRPTTTTTTTTTTLHVLYDPRTTPEEFVEFPTALQRQVLKKEAQGRLARQELATLVLPPPNNDNDKDDDDDDDDSWISMTTLEELANLLLQEELVQVRGIAPQQKKLVYGMAQDLCVALEEVVPQLHPETKDLYYSDSIIVLDDNQKDMDVDKEEKEEEDVDVDDKEEKGEQVFNINAVWPVADILDNEEDGKYDDDVEDIEDDDDDDGEGEPSKSNAIWPVALLYTKGHAAVLYSPTLPLDHPRHVALFTSVGQKNTWTAREKAPRDHRGQIIKEQPTTTTTTTTTTTKDDESNNK